MIPSGINGAYHTLTTGNSVDVNSSATGGFLKAKWTPAEYTNGTVPGESIATDPTAITDCGYDRACYSTGSLNSANKDQTYRFDFQSTDIDANAQINEQPDELYLEFEIFIDWDVTSPSGSDQWLFFQLNDTDGRGAKFINNISGGSPFTSITNSVINATTIGIPALKSFNSAWSLGQWYTVRIRYIKSSNPGTTVDGYIYCYAAAGSTGNNTLGAFSDQLSSAGAVRHYGGALRSIMARTTNTNAYTKPCTTYYRNLCWFTAATLPSDASMTSTDSWYHEYFRGRPQIGAQDEGTTAGTVKARVWSKYDRNQFGYETSTLTATTYWKYATDPDDWSTVRGQVDNTAVNLTANAVDQYILACTLDNLPENTEIDVRVQWEVDGFSETFHVTAKSTFRTVSRSTPAELTFIFSSCAPHASTTTPFSSYDVVAAESPHMVFHIGDLNYLDSANEAAYTDVAGYVALGGSTAARQAIVKQYIERQLVNNCQWDRLACESSCVLMPDDHDWINGFGGASSTPIDYTSGDGGTLRDEIEAIHRQYHGTRTFNYDQGEASSTVHYFRIRTAKCDILTFDCRRHNDLSTTPIGATQLSWARTIIQATTKPILILVSPVPWHSLDGAGAGADAQENWAQGSFADRNLILSDAQANTSIKQVILVSSDRHYVSINRSEFTAYPKVKFGDLCVGPFSQLARDYTEDTSPTVFQSQFGKTTSQVARGYLKLVVKESSQTVVASVVKAETTAQSQASWQYGGSTGYRGTRSSGRASRPIGGVR